MNNLKEKVIVITGAGQGLGEATSRVLGEAGAIIIPLDIKDDQVKKLAEELIQAGHQAEAMKLDVSHEGNAKEVIESIIAKYGRIDVLINNAGIDITKSIEELSIEEFDRVIRVNLRGPFVLSKMVLPYMEKQGEGQIVNIASTAAKRAWQNASAYHASKWGLVGLSHALHTEARVKGIKVTVIIAGGMKKPFILERFPEVEPNLQDPKNVAEVIKFVLMQPNETVIPEVMVIPMKETSWP